MNPFSFARPGSVETALASAAGHPQTAFLAGGTTLVDLLRLDVATPDALIDINALPLAKIDTLRGGGVRIGALVRNSDLANHHAIRERYPVLAQALLSGASPQIRNMATVGGNLMQRTRCYYFRDIAYACNQREPGSGCASIDGYNRIHAVLAASDNCIATFPGDMPVAMAALDAVVRARRAGGRERAIPIGEFYIAYGEDPARRTVLEPGELITAVDLPATAWFSRSCYVKVRDRASYDFALASAAVALDVADGRIRQCRVALGGVAGKPWRSAEAEKALDGAKTEEAAYRAAAEAALAPARPQKHNAFKIELARRTLVRALTQAAGLPS